MPVTTEPDEHTAGMWRVVTRFPGTDVGNSLTPPQRDFLASQQKVADGTTDLYELVVAVIEAGQPTPTHVHELFSDCDGLGQMAPAQRLHRFVQDLFVQRLPQKEQYRTFPYFGDSPLFVQATLGLIIYALNLVGEELSDDERGLLISARGVLRSRYAYSPGMARKELQLWAAQDHLEAADLLERSNRMTLARHNCWLAAALFTDLGRFADAAAAATRALCGHPRSATEGLYFSVAARCFFRLPEALRCQVRTAVLEDLALAYCLTPAVEEGKAEGESILHPQDTLWGRLTHEDRQRLGYAEVGEGLNTQYLSNTQWRRSALDRLAVLAMLSAGDSPMEAMAFWRYEAARLVEHWPEFCDWSILESRHVENLLAFLETLSNDTSIVCPPRTVQPDLPISVITELNAGRLAGAEAACREALSKVTFLKDPILWGRLWRCLTLSIARRRSSEDALQELEVAISTASRFTTTPGQAAYASLLTQKTWLLRYSGHTGEAEKYFDTARIHAAMAGNLDGVAWVNKHADRACVRWNLEEEAKRFRDWVLTLTQYFPAHFAMFIHSDENPFPIPLTEELPEGRSAVLRDAQRVVERLVSEEDQEMDRVFAANRLLRATRLYPTAMAGLLEEHIETVFLRLRDVPAHKHATELAHKLMQTNITIPEVRAVAAHHRLEFLRTELQSCQKAFQARRVGKEFVDTLALAVTTGCVSDPDHILEWLANSKTNAWTDDGESDEKNAERENSGRRNGHGDQVLAPIELLKDPTEEIENPQMAVTADQIKSSLKGTKACVLEFLVGKDKSVVLCVSEDEVRIIRISASASKLNAVRKELTGAARETGKMQAGQSGLETLHLFLTDFQRHNITAVERKAAQDIFDAAWKIWQDYGSLVLTPEVQDAILPFHHVYLVPHFNLNGMPLHLLPMEMGGLLAEQKTVLYLPSSGHLVRDIGRPKSGAYVAINRRVFTDVRETGSLLSALQRANWGNSWSESGTVYDRLRRMAGAQTVLLIGHGMYDATDPRNTRVAFENGTRLRVDDVEETGYSFEGTEVYVMSCFSGRARYDRTFAKPSFTRAFLQRGAEAVLSCLWEVNTQEAIRFTASLLTSRTAGNTRVEAYQNAVQDLLNATDHPMKKVALAGPFILYGIL